MARKGESGAGAGKGWLDGSWANKGGERDLEEEGEGRQYASNFGHRVYTEGRAADTTTVRSVAQRIRRYLTSAGQKSAYALQL